jgi:hypothetical protein
MAKRAISKLAVAHSQLLRMSGLKDERSSLLAKNAGNGHSVKSPEEICPR